MGYSIDLRKKVIEALEGGMTQADIEMTFGVSTGSIKRWKKLKEESGELAARVRSSESYDVIRGIKNHQLEEFKEFVLQNSELTNQEIGDKFGVSDSAIENYLKKVKISRKKRLMAIKNAQKRKEKSGKKK